MRGGPEQKRALEHLSLEEIELAPEAEPEHVRNIQKYSACRAHCVQVRDSFKYAEMKTSDNIPKTGFDYFSVAIFAQTSVRLNRRSLDFRFCLSAIMVNLI